MFKSIIGSVLAVATGSVVVVKEAIEEMDSVKLMKVEVERLNRIGQLESVRRELGFSSEDEKIKTIKDGINAAADVKKAAISPKAARDNEFKQGLRDLLNS